MIDATVIHEKCVQNLLHIGMLCELTWKEGISVFWPKTILRRVWCNTAQVQVVVVAGGITGRLLACGAVAQNRQRGGGNSCQLADSRVAIVKCISLWRNSYENFPIHRER